MDNINTVYHKPLTASDDRHIAANPDRGYRSEIVLSIHEKCPPEKRNDPDWRPIYLEDGKNLNHQKLLRLLGIYLPVSMKTKDKLIIAYVGFPDYRRSDISEGALEILGMFFELCRAYRVKVLFRCAYGAPHIGWYDSEESRKKVEAGCADEATMLRHIEQLAEFLPKYADVIHKMSSGFIGNGEYTYCYQYPPVNFDTIIKAVVEKICVPNGWYYSVRLPEYKYEFLQHEPDYKYADIIGVNNDAIFGEQDRPDWESGGFQLNNKHSRERYVGSNGSYYDPIDWWQYCCDTGAYTPQSGEMFVNANLMHTKRVPIGIEVITELAHHRYTTMSNWHTLYECPNTDNVMKGWIENEVVTPELLNEKGIIYDPAWFVDDEGERVKRNPYDFIRDHLGYKLQAISSTYSLIKDKIKAEIELQNFGFAAAFYLKSGFAILDENFKVVSEVFAGEPEKWYSHDPENYLSTEVLKHTVSAELPIPDKKGEYYLAFFMRNTMNDYAAFSNSDIPFKNEGYNVLQKIDLR